MKKSDELKEEWGLKRYAAALGIVSRSVVKRKEGWANWSVEELDSLREQSIDAFDLLGVLLIEQ